jgi:hypothetical protein
VAPVELIGLARRERQRHKGIRRLAHALLAPGDRTAADTSVAASKPRLPSSSYDRTSVRRSRAALLSFSSNRDSSRYHQGPIRESSCRERSEWNSVSDRVAQSLR